MKKLLILGLLLTLVAPCLARKAVIDTIIVLSISNIQVDYTIYEGDVALESKSKIFKTSDNKDKIIDAIREQIVTEQVDGKNGWYAKFGIAENTKTNDYTIFIYDSDNKLKYTLYKKYSKVDDKDKLIKNKIKKIVDKFHDVEKFIKDSGLIGTEIDDETLFNFRLE